MVRNMRGVRLFVFRKRSRIEVNPSFDRRKAGLILLAVPLVAYWICLGAGAFVLEPIFDLMQVRPAHPTKRLEVKPSRT